ncbi:ComF family protein [Isoalcanivorax indicus]|uniref:ComF family protein n=1 Tax=Isoalcanivorax indicus TaxID=2202653 RepID=UPI000DB9DE9D|nr:ComF family protein [Isoalcanivorax indicus]
MRCVLCGLPATADSALCSGCQTEMPPLSRPGHTLCRCGLPCPGTAPSPGTLPPLCGRCLHSPPPFERLLAPLAYAFPLDRVILGHKQQRRPPMERAFLWLWNRLLPLPGAQRPDLLVPVPLHWRRLWWRGFNPAWQLAHAAGTRLGIPARPVLARHRPTPSQQGLTAAARRRNLTRALRITQPIDGLHIALIDDVVTTGSTARVASQVLLDGGASRVEVWALARTLPSA